MRLTKSENASVNEGKIYRMKYKTVVIFIRLRLKKRLYTSKTIQEERHTTKIVNIDKIKNKNEGVH